MGNVHDNFKVEASGMIKVSGNVTQAILRAEGDIIVRAGLSTVGLLPAAWLPSTGKPIDI